MNAEQKAEALRLAEANGAQTPLVDLLEGVPLDARMIYEESPISSHSIPVGRLCHEAAALLRTLAAEPQEEPVDILRSDFELRMKAEGYGPTALTILDSGCYMSPAVEHAWEYEKRKYLHPATAQTPMLASDIVTMYAESPSSDADMIEFARAIERAHGIVSKG